MEIPVTRLIKFNDTQIDHESLKAVMKEIGEDEESQKNGLKELKRMLLDTADLDAYLNNNFLLHFLRVSKFSVQAAYQRILKYYRAKKKYQIFDICYPSSTLRVQQFKHISVLPYRAPDNSIIVAHRRSAVDFTVSTFEEVFLMDVLVMEYLLENPVTQMCGITPVIDFIEFSFEHFTQLSPRRIRMFVEFFQNSFPFRIKHVHIVNAPAIYTLVYNLLYPFLSSKIKNRVVVHSSNDEWRSLHKYLSPAVLPEEYGGHLNSIELVNICEIINRKEEYFRQQTNFGFRNMRRFH